MSNLNLVAPTPAMIAAMGNITSNTAFMDALAQGHIDTDAAAQCLNSLVEPGVDLSSVYEVWADALTDDLTKVYGAEQPYHMFSSSDLHPLDSDAGAGVVPELQFVLAVTELYTLPIVELRTDVNSYGIVHGPDIVLMTRDEYVRALQVQATMGQVLVDDSDGTPRVRLFDGAGLEIT